MEMEGLSGAAIAAEGFKIKYLLKFQVATQHY